MKRRGKHTALSFGMRGRDLFQGVILDRYVVMNIILNACTIVTAIIQRWDLVLMMWIYFFQSAIIALLQFVRIFVLKNFTNDGFHIALDDQPKDPLDIPAKRLALYFLLFFGVFHVIYILLLLLDIFRIPQARGFAQYPLLDQILITCSLISFAGQSLYHFLKIRKRDDMHPPGIGRLMMLPLFRIIPMHLTLVLGGIVTMILPGRNLFLLVIFLMLRASIEILMQAVEQAAGKNQDKSAPPFVRGRSGRGGRARPVVSIRG